MARCALLLISPPVLFGERWWANRIANKPHLASLAGVVRVLAEPRILELHIDARRPLPELLAEIDTALTDDIALVGISCWSSAANEPC